MNQRAANINRGMGRPIALASAPAALPWTPLFGEIFGDMGVNADTWGILTNSIFRGVRSLDTLEMALSYCRLKKLSPWERTVNIVPMWDEYGGENGKGGWVDQIYPSIAEFRNIAHRTGEYAGCEVTQFGPDIERTFKGKFLDRTTGIQKEKSVTVKFPEWAQITVTRLKDGVPWKFAGPTTYWLETYAKEGGTDVPNDTWCTRARGQLEKCAESAALRKAFPELGNEYTSEEMHGQRLRQSRPRAAAYVPDDPMDAPPPPPPPPPPPLPPEEDEEPAVAPPTSASVNPVNTVTAEATAEAANVVAVKPKAVTERTGPVPVKGAPKPKKPKPLTRAETTAKLKMAEKLIDAITSLSELRSVEATLEPIIAQLNVADALFVRNKIAEVKAFYEN